MLRKILPLMFLLILVSSDSALAGRHGRCCRRVRHCRTPCQTLGTDYCLRNIYMQFSNPPDLYSCLTYDFGCPNDDGYEDLWYGNTPNPRIPQECNYCQIG